MKIEKVITLHWGNLPNREYTLSEAFNLFVGDSGSGKSTMLDAIQTVMTATKPGYVNYNAGQGTDDVKDRTRVHRSFQSYLLGADRGRFTRKASRGVVCCVFRDEADNAMSAWVYGEASLDGPKSDPTPKSIVKAFGIAMNTPASLQDFVRYDVSTDTTTVCDHDDIIKNIGRKGGESMVRVLPSQDAYLAHLYGRIFHGYIGWPRATMAEVEKAAKAFSKFIYPKEIKNVHQFVKYELLEERNMDETVENLSGILLRSNELKEESRRIVEAKNSLEDVVGQGEKAIQELRFFYEDQYRQAKLSELRQAKTIAGHQKNIEEKTAEQQTTATQLEVVEHSKGENEKTRDELRLQIHESEPLREKQRLNSELADKQEKYGQVQRLYSDMLTKLQRCRSVVLGCAPLVSKESWQEIGDELERHKESLTHTQLDEISKEELHTLNVNLQELETKIHKAFDRHDTTTIAGQIEQKKEAIALEGQKLANEKASLQDELEKMGTSGRIQFPHDVETALRLLHQEHPEANARALCNHMEITDPKWSSAIEGFLKNNRFSIIVEKASVVSATKLLRREDLRGAKILQSHRILDDFEKLGKVAPHNSILSIMEFSDPIAEAYMYVSYNKVIMLDHEEELKSARRGITIDGMAAANYATFSCGLKDHECVLGKHAMASRREYLEQSLEPLREKIHAVNMKKAEYGTLGRNIDFAANVNFNIQEASSFHELLSHITRLKVQIDAIDLGDFAEVEKRIGDLSNTIKIEEDTIKTLTKQIGNIESELSRYKEAHKQALRDEESRITVRKGKGNDLLTVAAALRMASQGYLESIDDTIDSTEELKEQGFDKALSTFSEWTSKIAIHNTRIAVQGAIIAWEPFSIERSNPHAARQCATLLDENRTQLYTISEGMLYKKNEELNEVNQHFKDTFIDAFCTQINYNIESGINSVADLDRILKRHSFDGDHFRISYKRNEAYREYHEFFSSVASMGKNSGGLFEEEFEHNETAERIYAMLLEDSKDNNKKRSMLKEIADYRNYHDYDILCIFDNDVDNPVSLSKLASDSGGQAETSYYVIRAIAAYSSFASDPRKRKHSLQLLCVDEAFAKVDEYRPSKILDFLLKDLNMQLIVAMPTKNEQIFIPFTNRRYHIIKTVVNSSFNNYKLKVDIMETIMNSEAINELKENNIKQIEMKFDAAV